MYYELGAGKLELQLTVQLYVLKIYIKRLKHGHWMTRYILVFYN